MQIAVIGAGIGGLTFALSAHKLGIPVTVFEAVEKLQSLGVGINLQPNAVRELTALGLDQELAATGIQTAELAYFSKRGQAIWSEPRGLAAGYHWPQYSIQRGALQMVLLTAVLRRLGRNAVVTGYRLISFDSEPDSVAAHFETSKDPSRVTIRADLLVGADGIHSAVRKTLYPSEGQPKFGQWVMYRGAAESAPFLSGRTMISVGTRDQRFVAYPMSRQAFDNGRALVNWVASLPRETDQPLPREEWNRRVGNDRLLNAFADWNFDWLDVARLIEQTPNIYLFPFVDREPLAAWGRDRVTLLGDAAHPMYPVGSQAGSQAIVDARALAAALATFGPAEALERYERLRRPAMTDLSIKNRGLGAEAVLQIVEDRAPNGFERLEDIISREELEETAHRFKNLAGIDIEAVNNGTPYFEVV